MANKKWHLACQVCGEVNFYKADTPTECPNNPDHLIGEVEYTGEYSLPCCLPIPVVVESKKTTNDSPTIVARSIFNYDAIGLGGNLFFMFGAAQTGGGEGYVRVYDMNNAMELGIKTITSGTFEEYMVSLSEFPVEGFGMVEIQLYTNGMGEIECFAGTFSIG